MKIERFHERASTDRIRAGGAFIRALTRRRLGGLVRCRPASSRPTRRQHLGKHRLARGRALRAAPGTWKKPEKDGKRRGRVRMAYHPKFHASFRVGSPDAKHRLSTCPVRVQIAPAVVASHRAAGGSARRVLRAEQAAEALNGDREERPESILASARVASSAAAHARVTGATRPRSATSAIRRARLLRGRRRVGRAVRAVAQQRPLGQREAGPYRGDFPRQSALQRDLPKQVVGRARCHSSNDPCSTLTTRGGAILRRRRPSVSART